jgi:tRNA A37 N6-isopentenylltransferase MiaA
MPALKAIGYREFFAGSPGGWTLRGDYAAVKEEIIMNSKHYANRQETWFKRVAGLVRVNALESGALEKILEIVHTITER